MAQASARSGRLQWRGYGDPYLPAMILLMGLGMPAEVWPEAMIRRLVQSGFYVILPDNRDSGGSRTDFPAVPVSRVLTAVGRCVAGLPVTAPYRLEDMAGDIEDLMDELEIARAHIVGFSMGGMIAQVLAARAPHRVITMTSISSAGGNPETGLGKLTSILSILTRPPVSQERALEGYCRMLLRALNSSAATDPERVARLAQVLRDAPAGGGARQLMAILATGNRTAELSRIAVPSMVIHGSADPLLPPAAGRETARLIEGARYVEIPGMGHDLPEGDMETIVREIVEHCYRKVFR